MGLSEEDKENILIGRYIKLQRKASELYEKMEEYLGFEGKLRKAIEKRYPEQDDKDRLFKATMSVNPDKLIELIEDFRVTREEYRIAHQELRKFEANNPKIIKEVGSRHYY